jgi:anion-transporting  ArsA/GET3 family ATPase
MRRSLTGMVVLLSASGFIFADQKKVEVAAIRAQIKELQAEQKVTAKAVKAQYESILQVGKLTKAQVAEAKIALRNQEKTLLALSTDPDERKSIREPYDLLSRVLTGDVRVDNVLMERIRKQEKAHVALIHAVYSAKIKELQGLIRAVEQASHAKGRK